VINKRYIEVDENARSIDLLIDQTLFKQVLAHMIRNAVEASEENEKVRVGIYLKGEQVEFQVRNPAFIDEKLQTQIFQRDFSTKGEGRGIGTYSMRLLCEKYLHGEVSFVSSPHSGTMFRVVVPRYGLK
jgi:signal transduction histidine kinase